MGARNTLTQKVTGHGCTGTVKLDAGALQTGDVAGLGIVGFPHASIAVECGAGGHRLVMVNAERRVAEGPAVPDGIVYLRAEAARDGRARFSYSLDDDAYEALGDELRMQFSVKSFLGNKFGLFCFNAVPGRSGGHADFDFFRYRCDRGPANHRSAFEDTPAECYDAERGTDTQRAVEKQPQQVLVNVHDGDWVRHDHMDFGRGAAAFVALVSPVGRGGAIELRVGGPGGALIGECRVAGSGEKNPAACPWQQVRCAVGAVQGAQTLCLRFTGGDGPLMRLDWFRFEEGE